MNCFIAEIDEDMDGWFGWAAELDKTDHVLCDTWTPRFEKRKTAVDGIRAVANKRKWDVEVG